MLNAKAFANAVTVVTAIFYVVCWGLSVLAPDLIFTIGQAWAHTVNLESVKATATTEPTAVLFGLVSISVVAWITTYATIWLYNKWAK